MSLKTIAEGGLFNGLADTPLRSAQAAPLYEALNYLASLKAEGKFMEKLYEVK